MHRHLEIELPEPTKTATPSLDVADLIDRVENLLSLPDAVVRLNALLADPDVSIDEIGEVVRLDPALAARVLRSVNSAYYGLRARVDTLSQAISMIGTRELHTIALATSAALAFRNISSRLIDMESFWQHSVRAALAARAFATAGGRRDREQVFMAGLLHDVGQLVIYHQLPQHATAILQAVKGGESQDLVEQELLGFTHADVGAALLERWNLPVTLTDPVRQHHDVELGLELPRATVLVYLGSRVSHFMDQDLDQGDFSGFDAPAHAWAQAQCSPAELGNVILDVSAHWLQVVEIIAPGSSLV